MPCDILRDANGNPVGIVCTRGQQCSCGKRATLLCDGKVSRGLCSNVPCDAPLCERCAKHVGDRDLCPGCANGVEP